jgi:hypothetical protein
LTTQLSHRGTLTVNAATPMELPLRLVTEIYYEQQTILVRHVLTHSEYDKGDWKQ